MIRSLLAIAQIVLIILKLTNYIAISWWAVFIPLYILVGVYLIIFLITIGVIFGFYSGSK